MAVLHPVVAVFGTRPEAIKFAPVLAACKNHPALDCVTAVTGQQADLLRDQLDALRIEVHHRLEVMTPGQSLPDLLANTTRSLSPLLRKLAPRAVLVQGDTTTALAAALAAGFEGLPVVHIEAGLRSFSLTSPYPEEANRILITHATSLHCAATAGNVVNLINEGVAPEAIALTGNPIVDALAAVLPQARASAELAAVFARQAGRRMVTLTVHRRENFGPRLAGYVSAALVRVMDGTQAAESIVNRGQGSLLQIRGANAQLTVSGAVTNGNHDGAGQIEVSEGANAHINNLINDGTVDVSDAHLTGEGLNNRSGAVAVNTATVGLSGRLMNSALLTIDATSVVHGSVSTDRGIHPHHGWDLGRE